MSVFYSTLMDDRLSIQIKITYCLETLASVVIAIILLLLLLLIILSISILFNTILILINSI